MEVSSTSITPDSQLESRSCSPNRAFRPRDRRGTNHSTSPHRSPNQYDRDFHSGNAYMSTDDYDYRPYEGDRNTGNRRASPNNYDRGYSRSYGFSPVRNNSVNHYQAPNTRQFQSNNHSQRFGNRNRYINETTYSSQGRPSGYSNPNKRPPQLYHPNPQRPLYGQLSRDTNGYNLGNAQSNYHNEPQLSMLFSFVTKDRLRFEAKRDQKI